MIVCYSSYFPHLLFILMIFVVRCSRIVERSVPQKFVPQTHFLKKSAPVETSRFSMCLFLLSIKTFLLYEPYLCSSLEQIRILPFLIAIIKCNRLLDLCIKQVLDIAIKLFHNAHVSQLLLENRALQDMINMEE